METKNSSTAPLAVFRILFGLLMSISMIRFWANGWIEKLYLEPSFHFKYYGFGWIEVPSPPYCYLLFLVCFLSAVGITIGFKYRLSIILFFLSFTYIELMDKTTYLNHYYFISVLSFLMIFLPLNSFFSWDSRDLEIKQAPSIYINALRLLLAIVYIYAGLAKLNYDWLIQASPLSIWLPSKYHIPLIGQFMDELWLAYFFSWAGAFYDLFIVFFLLWKPTRIWAFITVVFFHLMTGILFPIGMFPYIMIASTLIFFSAEFHENLIFRLKKFFKISGAKGIVHNHLTSRPFIKPIFILFFTVQLILPLRFLVYPGNIFWTEEGYRFSWRVMLMEKAGYASFTVVDGENGKSFKVDNADFLTDFQEKQMATQPDFIVEYAHYLKDHFERQGHQKVAIYTESYVALNGARSKPYIDPKVNLLSVNDSFRHKEWILPYNE